MLIDAGIMGLQENRIKAWVLKEKEAGYILRTVIIYPVSFDFSIPYAFIRARARSRQTHNTEVLYIHHTLEKIKHPRAKSATPIMR